MSTVPDTRPSLMLRLCEADEAAWEEFVAIYRPVIVRLAQVKGLQHSDADDLAQQVLVSVSKSIGKWEHDPARARFRTWLARVVRNATLNALARQPADRAAGGTTACFRSAARPRRKPATTRRCSSGSGGARPFAGSSIKSVANFSRLLGRPSG